MIREVFELESEPTGYVRAEGDTMNDPLTKTKLELGLGTPPKESPLGHSFGKVHGLSVLRPTVSCSVRTLLRTPSYPTAGRSGRPVFYPLELSLC